MCWAPDVDLQRRDALSSHGREFDSHQMREVPRSEPQRPPWPAPGAAASIVAQLGSSAAAHRSQAARPQPAHRAPKPPRRSARSSDRLRAARRLARLIDCAETLEAAGRLPVVPAPPERRPPAHLPSRRRRRWQPPAQGAGGGPTAIPSARQSRHPRGRSTGGTTRHPS